MESGSTMSEDSAEPKPWSEALESWEAYGIPCEIRMGFIGFNGYVQLPEGMYRSAQVSEVFEAHWGLNYGPDEAGWIGFDTAHAGDYWAPDDLEPYMDDVRRMTANSMRGMAQRLSYGRRWTMDRLRKETEALAQQVAIALDLSQPSGS